MSVCGKGNELPLKSCELDTKQLIYMTSPVRSLNSFDLIVIILDYKPKTKAISFFYLLKTFTYFFYREWWASFSIHLEM